MTLKSKRNSGESRSVYYVMGVDIMAARGYNIPDIRPTRSKLLLLKFPAAPPLRCLRLQFGFHRTHGSLAGNETPVQ